MPSSPLERDVVQRVQFTRADVELFEDGEPVEISSRQTYNCRMEFVRYFSKELFNAKKHSWDNIVDNTVYNKRILYLSKDNTPRNNLTVYSHISIPVIGSTVYDYLGPESKDFVCACSKMDEDLLLENINCLVGLVSLTLAREHFDPDQFNISLNFKPRMPKVVVSTTNAFIIASPLLHLLLGLIRDSIDLAAHNDRLVDSYDEVLQAINNKDVDKANDILKGIIKLLRKYSDWDGRRPLNGRGKINLRKLMGGGYKSVFPNPTHSIVNHPRWSYSGTYLWESMGHHLFKG